MFGTQLHSIGGPKSIPLALGQVAGQVELFSVRTQLPRVGTLTSGPPSSPHRPV